MEGARHLRTGEVAAQAGVNEQTLRYYERIGLLPEPRRLPSGYRAYSPDAVHTVRFVKRAQALGFSLTEVRTLLHVEGGPDGCEKARSLADARATSLNTKIAELRRMRDELRRLVVDCAEHRHDPSCPLTEAIESEASGPADATYRPLPGHDPLDMSPGQPVPDHRYPRTPRRDENS